MKFMSPRIQTVTMPEFLHLSGVVNQHSINLVTFWEVPLQELWDMGGANRLAGVGPLSRKLSRSPRCSRGHGKIKIPRDIPSASYSEIKLADQTVQ